MSEVNFYVMGLPRSGTCWLANALNHGQEVFCFHECERDVLSSTPEHQKNIVQRRLYQKPHFASGNVSSGMHSWQLEEQDGPLIIIHRDWDEVESSVRFAMIDWEVKDLDYDAEQIKKNYIRFLDLHDHGKIIDFNHLFTVDTLVQIWKHCLPMLMPPVDRFEEVVRHKVVLKDFDYIQPTAK